MRTAAPISFAGSQLAETRHVCAFFNSDEEEYRVLLPFIKDGFECGHKAVHVVNAHQRSDHMKRLMAAGIDPEAAERSGNAPGGFPLSRIVCRMDWAAEGKSYAHDLIEFESRVNHVWEHHDDAVICTYHLGKFGGDTVIDIMRTHPMIIVGGILQRNPFFVPPGEFLREFRARGTERSTSASAGS
jgi:hypothetical protein